MKQVGRRAAPKLKRGEEGSPYAERGEGGYSERGEGGAAEATELKKYIYDVLHTGDSPNPTVQEAHSQHRS